MVGKFIQTKINSDQALLLIRPKAFDPVEVNFNDDFETIDLDGSDLEVFDIFIEEKSGPQLEDSKVVISAGRGMVDKENLELIETLASKLNAAIGGTRAIVDAGWMPYSQQVGQTGKNCKARCIYCMWNFWSNSASSWYERFKICDSY